MTDNADPQDSALRPAGSDLHPADPADDLTANTPSGATDDGPRDVAPAEPLPGDSVPGDGSVEHDAPHEPDAMRTATYGRESAAARADTADRDA